MRAPPAPSGGPSAIAPPATVPLAAPRRASFAPAFQCRVGARVFINREERRFGRTWNRYRHDLIREAPRGDCGGGAALALQREAILRLARYIVALGDDFGGLAERERVP